MACQFSVHNFDASKTVDMALLGNFIDGATTENKGVSAEFRKRKRDSRREDFGAQFSSGIAPLGVAGSI